MSKRFASFVSLSLLAAAVTHTRDADACGGCFVPVTENTVVTGHRMVMSISKEQSVLWDQIQYAGDPAEFSWVLPVKKGAVIEVANDAFFDVLETGTVTTVTQPPEGCNVPSSNSGCGASEIAAVDLAGGNLENGVTVIHQGTVGPYETVTLAAEDPNALNAWLDANGYAVPDDIQPTIDDYVAEGFDFIALKLQPNQGVSAMKPVRVVTPGAGFTLPLRMVAAGAGATVDIVLYVIGEGRYETANFTNATVPPELVTWDFRTDTSDYGELRLKALAADDGRTWLTSYAQQRVPLGWGPSDNRSYVFDDPDFQGFGQSMSIAEAYFNQGIANQEGDVEKSMLQACLTKLHSIAQREDAVIVDNCDAEGACAPLGPNEVSASDLACGGLDDLVRAVSGMHVRDVTLTRLEASLPRAALNADLLLQAAADQEPIAGQFTAGLKVNHCWDNDDGRDPDAAAVPFWTMKGDDDPLQPGALMTLMLCAAGFYLLARRRAQHG